MYIKIKGYYESIIDYFPEYSENREYIPPKRFLWDIFWTMDLDLANKFIAHSLKERNHKDQEGDKTIEVSEDVLNKLHSAHYFSKKKWKALFMLTASKELGIIKRKRKKSFINVLRNWISNYSWIIARKIRTLLNELSQLRFYYFHVN